MALSNEIITFAAGNVDLYEAAQRYYQFENERTAENTQALTDAFFAEVESKSGVKRDGLDANAWAINPSVKWASLAVVDAIINAIIPVTILPQFGMFCDFRTAGYGDIVKFRVQPRGFYTVSRGAHGMRTVNRQKKYASDIIVSPVEHIVTIYVDWYRVMAGKESLPDFLNRVIISVEQEMYADALNALTTGLAGITDSTGILTTSGAFDMTKLLKMCEKVQALNGGVKPVITGSASALTNVIPSASAGYRLNTDAANGSIEILRSAYGYDIVKLDNAVNQATGQLLLPDDAIMVVSPAQDKLLKGVMTTALSNSNDYFDNSDLTQNFTYRKDWGFEYASGAYAGYYYSIT